MIRYYSVLFFLLLFQLISFGQTNGVFPLTGIRYFNNGISLVSVDVVVDGGVLLTNRIPAGKDFEIKMRSLTGLTDKNKMIFPAIEWSIFNSKGVLLTTTANVLGDKAATGIPVAGIKELSVKLSIKPEIIKAEPGCVLKVRCADQKGKGELRLEFPITIARPGEVLLTAKTVSTIKSAANVSAVAVGLRIKDVSSTTDTSIRVNPKMAYASIEVNDIQGSTNAEILSGKEMAWVYDANGNEVKISDRLLKQVSSAMEDNIVDYLSKVPTRLKAETGKAYVVRFRWESPDKRKLFDIVVH